MKHFLSLLTLTLATAAVAAPGDYFPEKIDPKDISQCSQTAEAARLKEYDRLVDAANKNRPTHRNDLSTFTEKLKAASHEAEALLQPTFDSCLRAKGWGKWDTKGLRIERVDVTPKRQANETPTQKAQRAFASLPEWGVVYDDITVWKSKLHDDGTLESRGVYYLEGEFANRFMVVSDVLITTKEMKREFPFDYQVTFTFFDCDRRLELAEAVIKNTFMSNKGAIKFERFEVRPDAFQCALHGEKETAERGKPHVETKPQNPTPTTSGVGGALWRLIGVNE